MAGALTTVGVDADNLAEAMGTGAARKSVRMEHEQAVDEHRVWGVPTFVVDGEAAFVRLMDRHDGNPSRAVST
ncbi:MAG: DsbA family protein, partial [Acidimicrobiales bacterium]